MILGTMLGDGSMQLSSRISAVYRSQHGWCQHQYNQAKGQTLSAFVNKQPSMRKNSGYGKWLSVFNTRSLPIFTPFVELCYSQLHPTKLYKRSNLPVRIKTVTQDWLDWIDRVGFLQTIAWWYMDDGTKQGTVMSPSITWNTQGFTEAEVQLLAAWLTNHGFESICQEIYSKKRQAYYYVVKTPVEPTLRLLPLLTPYIVPSMLYKTFIARIDRQMCAYCNQEYSPQKTQSRDPSTQPRRPCCQQAECLKLRRQEICSRYMAKPGIREHQNLQSRDRYYANHEAAKRYNREMTRIYRQNNPAAVKASKRKAVAKAQASRRLQEWQCQRCGLTRSQGTTHSNTKYCPACRETVTKETKQQHEATKRTGMPIRTCPECQHEFQLNSNKQKWCSPECKKNAVNLIRKQKYHQRTQAGFGTN